MSKRNIILAGLVIVAGGFFLYALTQSKNNQLFSKVQGGPASTASPSGSVAPSAQTGKALEAKTNDESGVQVEVRPVNVSDASARWTFSVALNTHSGDLGSDLAQSSALIGQNGKEYAPTAWEGDPPGGHHRRGVLKFAPITPRPGTLTLVIRSVGGVAERKFEWQLQGR